MSDSDVEIAVDNPEADDVRELLTQHLAFAREFTPPGHVHALEIEALKDPGVTFYSARRHGQLLAVAALKRLDASRVELKSMHTSEVSRGRGMGGALISHLLGIAQAKGYQRVSLETGTMAAFAPARRLYQRMGFEACEPFGSYTANLYSTCMHIELAVDTPPSP